MTPCVFWVVCCVLCVVGVHRPGLKFSANSATRFALSRHTLSIWFCHQKDPIKSEREGQGRREERRVLVEVVAERGSWVGLLRGEVVEGGCEKGLWRRDLKGCEGVLWREVVKGGYWFDKYPVKVGQFSLKIIGFSTKWGKCMKNIVFYRHSIKVYQFLKNVFEQNEVKRMKNTVFYWHSVKTVNFREKSLVFQTKLWFRGLGEEREQTHTHPPTHALIAWEVGGGGGEGRLGGEGEKRRDDRINRLWAPPKSAGEYRCTLTWRWSCPGIETVERLLLPFLTLIPLDFLWCRNMVDIQGFQRNLWCNHFPKFLPYNDDWDIFRQDTEPNHWIPTLFSWIDQQFFDQATNKFSNDHLSKPLVRKLLRFLDYGVCACTVSKIVWIFCNSICWMMRWKASSSLLKCTVAHMHEFMNIPQRAWLAGSTWREDTSNVRPISRRTFVFSLSLASSCGLWIRVGSSDSWCFHATDFSVPSNLTVSFSESCVFCTCFEAANLSVPDNTILSIFEGCDLCTFESTLSASCSDVIPPRFDRGFVELDDDLEWGSNAHELRTGLCWAVALSVIGSAWRLDILSLCCTDENTKEWLHECMCGVMIERLCFFGRVDVLELESRIQVYRAKQQFQSSHGGFGRYVSWTGSRIFMIILITVSSSSKTNREMLVGWKCVRLEEHTQKLCGNLLSVMCEFSYFRVWCYAWISPHLEAPTHQWPCPKLSAGIFLIFHQCLMRWCRLRWSCVKQLFATSS